jgi:signal transduction histidine kinase
VQRLRIEETRWTPAVVRAICAVPLGTVVVAVVQHGVTPRTLTFGAVAALPWILLAFGVLLPWWLSASIELVGTAGFLTDPAAFDVAPLLLVVLVGLFSATERAWVGLVTFAAATAMLVGLELTDRFDGVAIWILGMALGWVAGFAVRLQDQAQAAREEQAADAERARIALELHDVVAHSLAVTMLNLSAARLALRRDPDEAESALRQAEESGRRSMTDIRRVVGRLGEAGASKPAPGAHDVDDLVRGFVDAGLAVQLTVDGDVDAVSPAVGLVLYRIVQESIANVVKHAPGAGAVVTIAVDPRCVRVDVRNGAAGARVVAGSSARSEGGFGLTGMAERAALVGGTVDAGPTDDGWCVHAELPVVSP